MLQRVVAVVLTLVAVVAIAALAVMPAHATVPSWCTYPAPAGVVALNAAVDAHVAEIHRWSPDQHPDRLTIQLDLMTQCAPTWR